MLSTNSPQVLQIVAGLWPDVTPQCASSFEMEVMAVAEPDCTPERLPHFRGLRHIVFAHLPPRSFLAYDLLRKRVHAVLSTEAAHDRTFWHILLFPITMGVLGATVGIVPLHCACLDRDGSGILIAGNSGAGKSTLAAALAQNGFSLVSDDWTYVSRSESSFLAHGLSAPIKLLPDAGRFFPELSFFQTKTALNGELAYEIDPRQLRGFAVKTTSVPRSILFLERTTARGCAMIRSEPEYLLDFFEKSGERLPDELSHARAFRSEIIRELSNRPCWILRTGESPRDTAESLGAFLAEKNYATV